MIGKPEAKRVGGAGAGMSTLLARRTEIGDLIDQVLEEFSVQFGELVRVQKAIGDEFYKGGYGRTVPVWLSESWTAKILQNRLAAALAEHSSGPANRSIIGPVVPGEPLSKVFTENHASVRKVEGAPPSARALGAPEAPPYDRTGGLRQEPSVLDGSGKGGNR